QPGRSLRFATLSPSEDPDSLIRSAGRAGFADVLTAARPLSEVLWQSELAARPIDTPERRADLERRLMEQAGLIADRAVQNEYRRFLRDRLFTHSRHPAGRLARSGPRRAMPPPFSQMPEGPPPPLPRDPRRVQREIILALLMQHP